MQMTDVRNSTVHQFLVVDGDGVYPWINGVGLDYDHRLTPAMQPNWRIDTASRLAPARPGWPENRCQTAARGNPLPRPFKPRHDPARAP
jgi:hypothetical protein